MTATPIEPLVLVVDDEADWRELLGTILEQANYRVLCAADGAAALRLLEEREGDCDVILLDLTMPGMSGWDFRCKQLANPMLAHIPVLLMSAGADIAGAGIDLNVAGILSKPVKIAELVNTVEGLLPRKQSRLSVTGLRS